MATCRESGVRPSAAAKPTTRIGTNCIVSIGTPRITAGSIAQKQQRDKAELGKNKNLTLSASHEIFISGEYNESSWRIHRQPGYSTSQYLQPPSPLRISRKYPRFSEIEQLLLRPNACGSSTG